MLSTPFVVSSDTVEARRVVNLLAHQMTWMPSAQA